MCIRSKECEVLCVLHFEGFLPHSVEFLICPDARSKPQGLGGSYLQCGVWKSFVLRGFRMSIYLMFHCFMWLQHFWWLPFEAPVLCLYIKLILVGHWGHFYFGFLPLCFSCVFSDKGRISPEFEPVAH